MTIHTNPDEKGIERAPATATLSLPSADPDEKGIESSILFVVSVVTEVVNPDEKGIERNSVETMKPRATITPNPDEKGIESHWVIYIVIITTALPR